MALFGRGGKPKWSIELDEDVVTPGTDLVGTIRLQSLPEGTLPAVHAWIESNANVPAPDDPLTIRYTDCRWYGDIVGSEVPIDGPDVRIPFRLHLPIDLPPSKRGGTTLGTIFPKLHLGDGFEEKAKASITVLTLPIHDAVRDAVDAMGWSIKKTEVWTRTIASRGPGVRWELMVQTEPAVDQRLPPGHTRPTVRLVVDPTSPTAASTPISITAVGPEREHVLAQVLLDVDLASDADASAWSADLRAATFDLLDPGAPAPDVPARRQKGSTGDWVDLAAAAFDLFGR